MRWLKGKDLQSIKALLVTHKDKSVAELLAEVESEIGRRRLGSQVKPAGAIEKCPNCGRPLSFPPVNHHPGAMVGGGYTHVAICPINNHGGCGWQEYR